MKKDKLKIVNIIAFNVVGNALLAFSLVFILKADLMVGGMAGVGVIFNRWLDISIVITILTWVLFLVGYVFLGKKFAAQTLISTILYPLFVALFNIIIAKNPSLILEVKNDIAKQLIYAIVAGTISGLGLGLVFKIGGSTGGFDVLSILISKKLKIKLSHAVFLLDSIVIACGLIVGHDWINIVIGLMSSMLASILINRVIIGGEKSVIVEIISDQYLTINEYIQNVMERGSTLYNAKGGWKNEDRIVLQVAVSQREYYDLIVFIHKVDKSAFVVSIAAHEVFGNGFKQYRN